VSISFSVVAYKRTLIQLSSTPRSNILAPVYDSLDSGNTVLNISVWATFSCRTALGKTTLWVNTNSPARIWCPLMPLQF